MCDTHGPDIARLLRYLVGSNDKLGRLQEKALRRLVAMYRNPGERVGDHGVTREACLHAWAAHGQTWPSRWRPPSVAPHGHRRMAMAVSVATDTAGHHWGAPLATTGHHGLFGMCI